MTGRSLNVNRQASSLADALHVLMPGPGRHAEDVALLPVETLAVDDRVTAALGDLIDEAAGVPVRPRASPGRSICIDAPIVCITGPPVTGLT